MNYLHIRRFVDRLQSLEQKGSKDFVCSISDAKSLHKDITKLLLDLESDKTEKAAETETVTVTMNGGSF